MFRQLTNPEQINFTKQVDPETGTLLVPAIVVDSERLGLQSMLMVANMDREALDMTMETGYATFWSRSRQGLWTKGESSGNLLVVRGLYTDCDYDVVLVDADPMGPTCHNGTQSCFEQNDPNV